MLKAGRLREHLTNDIILPARQHGACATKRSVPDEILVRQVLFPPLMNGIKTPHWGKEIVSVGGGLTRGWKGDATLLGIGSGFIKNINKRMV